MDYEVVVTPDAESDMNAFLDYLFYSKQNVQAVHLHRHRYFMMYRLEGETAIVDRVFHDLQDYRNHI